MELVVSSSPTTGFNFFFFRSPVIQSAYSSISFSSSCLPHAIFVINFQCRALLSSPHWQKNPSHTWNHWYNSLYMTHAILRIFRLNVLDRACALWVITVSLTKFWLQLFDWKLHPWKCIQIVGFSLFQLLLLLIFRNKFFLQKREYINMKCQGLSSLNCVGCNFDHFTFAAWTVSE